MEKFITEISTVITRPVAIQDSLANSAYHIKNFDIKL